MRMMRHTIIGLVAAIATTGAWADDLTGVNRFLCAAVQVSHCLEGNDCEADLPWNLNVPEFIEVDLVAKKLSTTAASGENRSTPISHLSRDNGTIALQGFEMGRGFSFVISEESGHVTVAVAADGRAVVAFGACTPLATAPAKGE